MYLQRKTSEKALKASEKRFLDIAGTASEGIWAMDELNHTTFVNQRMADALSYTVEEIMRLSYSDFVIPEDRADFNRRMKERRKGMSGRYEIRLRCKDSSLKRMLVSATPVTDDKGRYAGSLGMFLDISEKKL
jgi:PAS domain S-box-containing protein